MLETLVGAMPPDPHWQMPLPNGDTSWMYPICIILGFIVAITLGCLKLWKRYKVSTEPFYWFIIIGVPCAILGARFGSCAIGQTAWSDFFVDFGRGLAIEWGVMLVVLAAFIYFPLILKMPRYRVQDVFNTDHKVKKVSMWMYFDAIVPAILIAQFIGRWGNYCNQEVYGIAVTSEGLANFLYKVLPGMYIGGEWKQPLFLWEGLGNLGMFFILYFGVEFIKQRKAGDMAGAYFVWYGVFRACLEPLRDEQFGYGTSIITSIVWAVLGIVFILSNHLLIAKVREYKIFRALFNFGPATDFRMINMGWKKYIIAFKKKKLEKNERVKNVAEKLLASSNNQNNDSLKTKINKINQKIKNLKSSIEKRESNLDKYVSLHKEKRKQKILKSYNKQLNKLKQKHESMSKLFDDQLKNITNEQEKQNKKIIFDKKLKEISSQINLLQSEDVETRQAKYEQKYQACVRKPVELIYYGAW